MGAVDMEKFNEEYKGLMELYAELSRSNLYNQDKALIQVSGALFAVLATLGLEILRSNPCVGIVTISLLGLTVMQVLLGFWLSNEFFHQARVLANENHGKGNTQLLEGLDRLWPGKINRILNTTVFLTFGLALIAFIALISGYING